METKAWEDTVMTEKELCAILSERGVSYSDIIKAQAGEK